MLVTTGARPAVAPAALRSHAAGTSLAAPATSLRSRARPARLSRPVRAAAGDSAVCPVMPTSHAEPTPTGRPNVTLRPVSEVAVSSSKALEAFKASGGASRACARRAARFPDDTES